MLVMTVRYREVLHQTLQFSRQTLPNVQRLFQVLLVIKIEACYDLYIIYFSSYLWICHALFCLISLYLLHYSHYLMLFCFPYACLFLADFGSSYTSIQLELYWPMHSYYQGQWSCHFTDGCPYCWDCRSFLASIYYSTSYLFDIGLTWSVLAWRLLDMLVCIIRFYIVYNFEQASIY